MSSEDTYLDYLDDILQAIKKAEQFISEMNFQEFINDDKTIFAVIRALEILGEASNKIPKSVRQEYEQVPWSEMIGMRNKLIHDYMGVNVEVIWKTTKEDLPKLEKAIKLMKKELTS